VVVLFSHILVSRWFSACEHFITIFHTIVNIKVYFDGLCIGTTCRSRRSTALDIIRAAVDNEVNIVVVVDVDSVVVVHDVIRCRRVTRRR